MQMMPGKENRLYPRFEFRRPVRVGFDSDMVMQRDLALDLSAGGVRLRSSVFLPLGSELTVMLQEREDRGMISLLGNVVWVRYNPSSEIYTAGVKFLPSMEAKSRMISAWRQG